VVGRIIRPHGIRGAVIVAVESDWPEERFRKGVSLLLEAAHEVYREVTVESSVLHKGNMMVYLSGVDGRDAAEELKGRYLMVRACDARQLGEGEYWAHELVGMSVVDEGGLQLGEVSEVICRQAQDLLVVRGGECTEFQVPFVEKFIKGVDADARVITIEVIDGMVP
jgi:16S rRNA processing protein RimM